MTLQASHVSQSSPSLASSIHDRGETPASTPQTSAQSGGPRQISPSDTTSGQGSQSASDSSQSVFNTVLQAALKSTP